MCLRPCSEDGRAEGEEEEAPPAAGEQGEESAGLHVDEEQSEWPESDMVMEAEASGEGVPGAEVCLIMPTGLLPDWAAASCCISAVAFLLLSFLNSEVLRAFSPWPWWW